MYCRVAEFPDVIVMVDVSSTLHEYEDTVPSSSVAVPVSVPDVSSVMEEAPDMVTVGGWLATTLVTVTAWVSEPVAPSSSVTVRVKVTSVSEATCEAVYCRVAAFPVVIVMVDVSSTLHEYEDTVPSSSVAVPVSVPDVSSVMEEAPDMVTVGGWLATTLVTVTAWVSEPVAPSSSVTVRVKVTSVSEATCEAVYCRVAEFPDVIVMVDVSSTLHEYEDTVPSSSVAVPVSVPDVSSVMEEAPDMVTVGGWLATTLVTVTCVGVRTCGPVVVGDGEGEGDFGVRGNL